MRGPSPLIVLPDLVTRLDPTTPMNDGMLGPGGGGALLPGTDVQPAPHAGGSDVVSAKPLNAFGAGPPDSWLSRAHWTPHHVTVPPVAAVMSPRTNVPLARNANTSAFWAWLDGR